MSSKELRLHGMSGTPPRQLLYTDPVTYDRSAAKTKIWETNRDLRAEAPFRVSAFHWGSLTSGSKITAFWILLSPFMFANVAGWMADGKRWTQAFIRLGGLALTALFVSQLAVVVVDLSTQTLAETTGRGWAAGGGGLALGLVFAGIIWGLSTRSSIRPLTAGERTRLLFGLNEDSLLPPESGDIRNQFEDPAPGATLSTPEMWSRHSILHRLRRLHLGGGLLVIAVVLEWGLGAGPMLWISLGLLAITALSTLLAFTKRGLVLVVTRLIAPISVLVLLAAAAHVIGTSGVGNSPWPHVHQVVFYSALIMGAASIGAASSQLVSLLKGNGSSPFLPAGAFAIAGLVGGGLGVALALIAESAIYRWAGPLNPIHTKAGDFEIATAQVIVNGGGWIAVAMLVFLLGFLALAGLAAIWQPTPVEPGRGDLEVLPDPDSGRTDAMLRRVTRRSRFVFGAAGLLALVLGSGAILNACDELGCDPTRLNVFDAGRLLPIAMLVIVTAAILLVALAVSLVNLGAGLGVALVGTALMWLVYDPRFDNFQFEVPLLGLPVNPTEIVDLSVLIMILGLAYLILRSIIGGIASPDSRRQVGMLWDTGSFWPRWFHPLGPPAYGPAAVQSLRQVVADPSQRPKVLTAHSQGSVIATVALSGVEVPELPEGFVTYGSPLGILYSRLFPSTGVRELIEGLDDRWLERVGVEPRLHWINLWRRTDPLGGEPIPGLTDNRLVVTGTGHSQYELTSEFWEARGEAVTGVG